MAARMYSARWLVLAHIDEPSGKDRTQRMQDENALMLAMHLFLADQRVADALRDALKPWAGDREIEQVVITALDATHPDNQK